MRCRLLVGVFVFISIEQRWAGSQGVGIGVELC